MLPSCARRFRLCLWLLAGVLLGAAALPAGLRAEEDPFTAAVAMLNAADTSAKQQAIAALVALNDPRAVPVLAAMLEGNLYARKPDGRMVIGGAAGSGTGAGRQVGIADAATGEPLGTAAAADFDKVAVNNRLRSLLRPALARLQIAAADPALRLAAAESIAADRSPETAALLREALAREGDGRVREAMTLSLAKMNLLSPDRGERLAAVEALSGSLAPQVRALLNQVLRVNADGTFAEPDAAVRAAAERALARTERNRALIDLGVTLFQGISLGSVLLLAAVGLAITFGVMGVINMAHGEMIMLGAYTTFVVQELFRAAAPHWTGLGLPVAIPAAFVVAGAFGMVLERGVIRFLYGRPLETLLATWGISLMLQQLVRSVFGGPNREVANPPWMTGGVEVIGGAMLTWNRLYIIVFSLLVLGAVALILRYTRFGLQMRAVTQNRGMAAAMGIRTSWIDAATFGLGSGIAGVAGVALSQIGNVSPNLGQAYIIDSFMVVAFGGVGSLWGVLAAAMSLGIVNKVLEPYAGAMLGKILVLVLLILFIQKRPRGLFALKGRAAEG